MWEKWKEESERRCRNRFLPQAKNQKCPLEGGFGGRNQFQRGTEVEAEGANRTENGGRAIVGMDSRAKLTLCGGGWGKQITFFEGFLDPRGERTVHTNGRLPGL